MRTRGLVTGFVCMAALGGVGCAASGPAFQKVTAPTGKSVIYAYRSSSIMGAAIQPAVHCGSDSAVLSRGGYHPFVVDPGAVTCSASTESTAEVNVDAKPGEENYVRESIGVGFFVGRPHLKVMDKQTGEQEASDCKLQ